MIPTPPSPFEIIPNDIGLEQLRLAGYHLAPTLLAPGSVILPGNWGRIVSIEGNSHSWHIAEQTLEAVRSGDFPNKPSRLHSAFYFPQMQHALWYWANKDKRLVLYYVVPVDPHAAFHHGYMSCLPPLSGMADDDVAKHYWAVSLRVGVGQYDTAIEEVVTNSPLRILSQIEIKPDMFHDD